MDDPNIKFVPINAEIPTEGYFTSVVTAPLDPDHIRMAKSIVGVSYCELPGDFGKRIILTVVDGAGVGAHAMLNEQDIQEVVTMILRSGYDHGMVKGIPLDKGSVH